MATLNSWLTGSSFKKILAFAIFVITLSACSTSRRSPGLLPSQADELAAPAFPQSGESSVGESEIKSTAEPEVPSAPPGVVLAMSSGGARSYCHAGVLKFLDEERIPIRAIVGVELGAVVGGLYVLSRSYNDAEWKIHQLKDDKLGGKSGFLSNLLSSQWRTREFEASLEKALQSRRAPLLRTRWGTLLKVDGRWTFVEKRPDFATLRQAVRDAISEGNEGLTGELPLGMVQDDLVNAWESARTIFGGPVVWVDCTPKGDDLTLKALKPEVVLVPELKGIGPFDFSKKSEAKFRGKVSARKAAEEIKEWAVP